MLVEHVVLTPAGPFLFGWLTALIGVPAANDDPESPEDQHP